MKFKSYALAAAVVAAAGTAHAAPVTAASVTYDTLTFGLTVRPTGPTDFSVKAGETFTVSGFFDAVYIGGSCPNCITQLYLAGLNPLDGQINLFSRAGSGNGVVNRAYSGTFVAPTEAGTYYIGGAFTWDFGYRPIDGSANTLGQVSYTITVPEPTSVALMLTALGACGLATQRKRKAIAA